MTMGQWNVNRGPCNVIRGTWNLNRGHGMIIGDRGM